MEWKKGRGKLGLLNPLLGSWFVETETENMGKVTCKREFKKILDDKYVQLSANWEYSNKSYNEIAFIGVTKEKEVTFWSFTSDGKQSSGKLADVSDLHPDAFGFEAQMDAGLARMAYWPDDEAGFHWVVESHTKKGWNRFVDHHYLPVK